MQHFEGWKLLRDGSSVSQNSTSEKSVLFGFSSSILVCLVLGILPDFRNSKKMLNIIIQLLKLSFSYLFITDTQSSHAKLCDRHEKHNVFAM